MGKEEGRREGRSEREEEKETQSDERLLRPAGPLPGGRHAGRCAQGQAGRETLVPCWTPARPTRAHRSLSRKGRQRWEGRERWRKG